jgi:hypothetical protein
MPSWPIGRLPRRLSSAIEEIHNSVSQYIQWRHQDSEYFDILPRDCYAARKFEYKL